jgi:hypothetical protein
MKSPIVIFFFMCFAFVAFGQSTGINNPTPNSNAALDVVASGNQGMLIPRITDAQRLAITNPPIGLICYSTTNNTIWYYNGTVWVSLPNSTSGAGAANKLAFWSGASTLGFNTNLHWDNTNGRLGIGTVLPTASLSVGEKFLVDGTTGQLNFTDATGNIQFPAVTGTPTPMMYMFASGTANADRMVIGHSSAFSNWGLQYTDSDDKFHFVGNGTKYMTITLGNGNIGIGTTTPNAPLQFGNNITNRKIVLYESGNNDHQYYGFGINGGTLRYQTDATAADHVFFSGAGATVSTELMRIKGNGKVGIGNSSPQEKFVVQDGNISIQRADNVNPQLIISGDAQGLGYNLYMDDMGDGNFHIEYTALAQRGLTVSQSNTVGIGIPNPLSTLHVNGDMALGSGTAANGANKALTVFLKNDSGNSRNSGDIVVASTTSANSFTVTTIPQNTTAIGVLVENCAIGATCRVAVAGVATVNSSSGSIGQHCTTSGTAGLAASISNPSTECSIGIYLTNTTGTQCQVLLK